MPQDPRLFDVKFLIHSFSRSRDVSGRMEHRTLEKFFKEINGKKLKDFGIKLTKEEQCNLPFTDGETR